MASTKKSSNRRRGTSLRKTTKRVSRRVRAKVQGLDMTDVLLIVIVLLVLYFVLVDNNGNRNKLADVSLDLDVNVGDTSIGVDTEVVLDKDSLSGGLGVNIDDDRAYLEGDIDFGDNGKYGVGAYLGVDDDLYGINLGYNSKREKGYFNVGEIEGFLDYGPADLKPNNNEVVLAFFHADWCKHCKDFMPTWDETVAQLNNTKTENGKTIKCVAVESKNEKVMKEYGVNGYPTIIVINDNQKKETFKNERTTNNLKEFVEMNA